MNSPSNHWKYPFQNGFPEVIEYLEHGVTKCISFNRSGTLLAGSAPRSGKCGEASAPYFPSASSFNKKGDLIYVGNFKGEILVIDTHRRQTCTVVLGNAVIRQIVFSRNGENGAVKALAFLIDQKEKGVNMSRDVSFLKFTQDFRDTVNKMHRKVTCFNGDCECIVGASCSKGEYKIHIWNRNFGRLARIVEAQKEGLADLAWHPTRPVVTSVSMSGVIYFWAKDYTENWISHAFSKIQVKPLQVDEDANVDILTTEKVAAFSDNEESVDGFYFLPTLLDRSQGTYIEPDDHHTGENFEGQLNHTSRFPYAANAIYYVKVADDEVGPNGRIKYRRRLLEKAAELQAERGRIVKTSGFTSRLRKVQYTLSFEVSDSI
uniref:Uncharacterized protein n=1 Tax=Physcomitrium patens TaxID=3218 RepID=A0A2K1KML8_PHYPA|nr:hypothetical protein PHYPA_005907 [Physcomitrium patens]